MGLFDGVNGSSDEGSTAEIAKLLGLPVVLVVDASNAARSVAAVVKGFAEFDPQIRLAGVILNGAAGPVHLDLLRQAIAPIGVPVLGWFPKLPELRLQERHLGLVTAGEKTWNPEQVGLLIRAVETHLDLNRLLASCDITVAPEADGDQRPPAPRHHGGRRNGKVHIGIARDRAFSFYYQSSLDALCAAGRGVGGIQSAVGPVVTGIVGRTLSGRRVSRSLTPRSSQKIILSSIRCASFPAAGTRCMPSAAA